MSPYSSEYKEKIEDRFIEGSIDDDLRWKIKDKYLKIFSKKEWKELFKILLDDPAHYLYGESIYSIRARIDVMKDLADLGFSEAQDIIYKGLEIIIAEDQRRELFIEEDAWFEYIYDSIDLVPKAKKLLEKELEFYTQIIPKQTMAVENFLYFFNILIDFKNRGFSKAEKLFSDLVLGIFQNNHLDVVYRAMKDNYLDLIQNNILKEHFKLLNKDNAPKYSLKYWDNLYNQIKNYIDPWERNTENIDENKPEFEEIEIDEDFEKKILEDIKRNPDLWAWFMRFKNLRQSGNISTLEKELNQLYSIANKHNLKNILDKLKEF